VPVVAGAASLNGHLAAAISNVTLVSPVAAPADTP